MSEDFAPLAKAGGAKQVKLQPYQALPVSA
ncbi:hypothetical protein ROSI111154_05345 [Rouxiella silvae]